MGIEQKWLAGVIVSLFVTIAPINGAWPATMEQAIGICKERLTPPVRTCVRQKMTANSDPDWKKYVRGCQASVKERYAACISELIGAAGFKHQPIEEASESKKAAARSIKTQTRVTVPPRTIEDITAILDQEKPDPVRLKKLQIAADAFEPTKVAPVALAHFYFERAVVRSELGRQDDAVADSERAVQLATGKVDLSVLNNFRFLAAAQREIAGDTKGALDIYLKMVDETEHSPGRRFNIGFLLVSYRKIAEMYLRLGDFGSAQKYVGQVDILWKNASAGAGSFRDSWLSLVEAARGALLEAEGQLEDALRCYEIAERLRRNSVDDHSNRMLAVPRSVSEGAADQLLFSVARIKARLGRLAEGENDARRALLNRLRAEGKYAPGTARAVAALGALLVQQGRYEEAKKLILAAADIFRQVGMPTDSQGYMVVTRELASVQSLLGQWDEASTSYATIELATAKWDASRRAPFLGNFGRIETLYRTSRVEHGLAVSKQLLDFRVGRYGEQNFETELARGLYAVGLAMAKRDNEALAEFHVAVPVLTATTFDTDSEDFINGSARTRYIRVIIENYIALLGRLGSAADLNVVSDTFRLADSIRSGSVQKALTAAGARMNTSDPKLAAAVRGEQDLRQRIGIQLGQINSLLALPPAERDDAGIAAIRNDISRMSGAHLKVRAGINQSFPEYAELIDPKPPTTTQITAILKPGEALLSFYFGHDASFAWAIGQNGKVLFVTLKESAATIEDKIKKLREALEPQATMISDIPVFDVALSHDLYKTLLEPLKDVWGDAKSLIVVTNGALGLLPLNVLTTAPHQLSNDGPTFSSYRKVPWLARTHAVTMVPSASALRTLRRLPPGSSQREKLIAFGDPWFHDDQSTESSTTVQLAADGLQTRGIPLKRRAALQADSADSVSISDLPRLPDTADELRSIAAALEADPTKALHLGRDANEDFVKKADLSGFKIIAFATHGLLPGELDGLDQPALALSSPVVTGGDGDGILTMEEILSLKLDADWVVLSACNTGAGAGAGAEAVSGLGRAFFYAGTRAILVTNWSVHSESARDLVTDLFHRQAVDASLSRSEALRQAMMALLDGKGFTDNKGDTVFAYAHPLFWAPYTIIGDGN